MIRGRSFTNTNSLHCLIPTLPVFTDFYRFFGLSCQCITKCVIHQLVCQVYYSLVSLPPPPFPPPPPLLLETFFGSDLLGHAVVARPGLVCVQEAMVVASRLDSFKGYLRI